jgi:hypothetical protein
VAEGSLSRRRALKLFAGTALAALIPSRALADDDCVRVCHVPRTSTGACDFANARTICVSRRERRRHLENHPCDCRGRCASCLCLPNGEPCTEQTAQQCCSLNCDSSGFCLPPTGQTLIHCDCRDGSRVSRCLSVDCNDPDTLSSLCTPLCANNAGVLGILCAPNTPACA